MLQQTELSWIHKHTNVTFILLEHLTHCRIFFAKLKISGLKFINRTIIQHWDEEEEEEDEEEGGRWS
jgi:hypothetical protein